MSKVMCEFIDFVVRAPRFFENRRKKLARRYCLYAMGMVDEIWVVKKQISK